MITERRMKKKALLGLFSLFLIFTAYEVFPIYANLTPIILVSTKMLSLRVQEQNVIASVSRFDIFQGFQHFVRFHGTCQINGIPFINVTTQEYPFDKIFSETTSIPEEWKYTWDGNITFVKAPGPPTTYIKYDHPDNYETYRPGEVNIDYELHGYEKIHCHISQHRIEQAIADVSLGQIILVCYGILMSLLAIPEGVISKVALGVILLIIGILELLGQTIKWFLEDKLQTELGDGWTWMWGFGTWWIFKWWWQSFGAFRDWGWFFVIFNWNVYNYIPLGSGGKNFMCVY